MEYQGKARDTLQRNLTMMTDFYELTMMQGYLRNGLADNIGVFDLFFRKRDDGQIMYAIMAGVEQLCEYIENLHFDEDDIEYLRSQNVFDEEFLTRLASFRFTGEIYAIPEGTPVFPMEPLVRVRAPLFEAQLVETALLTIINHQTLIATKASRVVYSAKGGTVMEFGLRRAQGPDAGNYGARAAVIGGCSSTSNVYTGKMFDVPISGTHAHAWAMSFPDELTAFRAYADTFPNACLLLVDTYDTLRSGVPNAITVFRELREKGIEPRGIRLDSGDLAYLSIEARKMLDEAGFPDTIICASSDLDEYVIQDLLMQGARIDTWGVGTKMITGDGCPALGGVYKLSAEYVDGVEVPKLKKSENPIKVTNPGVKKIYRIFDNETGRALADLITRDYETIDTTQPLEIFDPINTWKRKTITDFHVRELLVPIFIDGKCVYELPTLKEICAYSKKELSAFWDQYRRLNKPHVYKVDLSQELYDLKQELLHRSGK
ncbi:MAG: nicotinate phosphoribosyltransferase [Clostridia bacterium]|nr:nicotinate phosphoribosyltransferase [Clostridia bacterium]